MREGRTGWVRGVTEGEGMLGVEADGARGLIKGEGVLEARMDRGTNGMRMMERGEMDGWMRRKEAERRRASGDL